MPLLTVLLGLPLAYAWPLESSWATIDRGATPLTDDAGDVESTLDADYLDLVGTAAAPVASWYADADTVYLRMRVSESPWLAEAGSILQQGSWTFGLELDGDEDTLDAAIAFSGSALGENTVLFYRNNGGESGVDAPLSLVYTYSTSPLDDGAARLAEASSTIDGEVDWSIDLAIDRATLYTELGIGPTTGVKLALLTANGRQSSTHDADLAGPSDLANLRRGWSDTLFIDGDGDELTDPEERLFGTTATDADTDDDGLTDGREVLISSDALTCDTDGDSLPDGLERGIPEPDASTDLTIGCFLADLEPTTKTDASQRDTDLGGMEDGDEDWSSDGAVGYWEIDPLDGADDVDTDVDGIPDAVEAKCVLDRGEIDEGPDGDTDGDTLSDAFEWSIRHLRDADGDGDPNFCDRDSDDDDIADWDEGTTDSDGDGIPDSSDTDSDNNGVLDEEEGPDADNDSDGTPDFQDTDDEDGPTGDADGDGLRNDEEEDCGADPLDPDTDDDGVGDEQEGPCTEDVDCDGVPNVLDPTDDELCDERDPDEGENPLTGDTFTGGNFTGGACSSGGGAASLAPAVLALLSLLRRRGGLALLLGLPSTAMAGEAATAINAQRFRPSLTAERFVVLNDTQLGQPLDAGAGLWLNYAHHPFVYRYNDPTRDDFPILSNVVTANLTGWVNLPYVRLGADLPLHLISTGYAVDGFRLLGDARLMAAGEIIPRGSEGLGVSALAFVDVPTGNETAWLGEGRAVVGAQGAASYELGPLLGVANLGLRSGTGQLFPDDLRIGPRLDWGVGGSYAINPAISAALELNGELILGGGTIGARPAEVMASGRYRVLPNLLVSGGLGAGISRGVGAPDVRLAAGVALVPALREDVPPPPAAPDRDHDGIADAVDLCPDQPEDLNGIDDGDGCPEGELTPTRVRVLDAAGNHVSPARLELVSGPSTGSFALSDGELVRSLEPGAYRLAATADGYTGETVDLDIPKARTHEHTIRLSKVVAPATVRVMVRDNQGRPLNATLRILGGEGQRIPGSDDGLTEISLAPGAYGVLISADGYRSLEKSITLDEGGSASLDVQLEPSKVVVQQDQVVILDKVFFELDSAVIRAESYALLDEVAETLLAHPEIALVEVQGHTDDQGRDAYNLELSEKRAKAVLDYLVRSGVSADRLTSKGYGESQPLMNGVSEDARAANRRVEFHIRKRSTTR